MLKTNSKKAKENIKQYIVNNTDINSTDFNEVAKYIINNFNRYNCLYEVRRFQHNYQAIFADWLHCLPVCLELGFIYQADKTAKDDLMAILEETEEEVAKYSEKQAEELLIYLIYRELTKVASIKFYNR